MGIKVLENLLLFICSSHVQSCFTECTSRVSPEGILNHPQHKRFIPPSITNRLCNKTSVFHSFLQSLFSSAPPHLRVIILLTLSQAVQVHQFVQSSQWTGKGDSDLLAKFVF